MITKFKIFENNEGEPEVGDYIIFTNLEFTENDKVDPYLESHIGKLIEIKIYEPKYLVLFENLPDDIFWDVTNIKDTINFYREEILDWSKNKEELKTKLAANNYNL